LKDLPPIPKSQLLTTAPELVECIKKPALQGWPSGLGLQPAGSFYDRWLALKQKTTSEGFELNAD